MRIGDGEAILRVALARTIAAHSAAGKPLRDAVLAALAELQRITGGSSGAIAIDHVEHVYAQLSATMPIAWIDEPAPVIRWASLFDGRKSTVLPFRHSLEKDELDRAPRGLTLVLSELRVNLFMCVSAKRAC